MYLATVHNFALAPGIDAELIDSLMTISVKRWLRSPLTITFPLPAKQIPLYSDFVPPRFEAECGSYSIVVYYHRSWPHSNVPLSEKEILMSTLLVDILINMKSGGHMFSVAMDETSESGIRIIQNT